VFRPFAVLRERIAAVGCIGDQPEADAKFRWWRDAQLNDRYLIKDDPQREEMSAAIELGKSDPKAAFPQLLALAQGGSVWSMLYVGTVYARDTIGAKDFAESERWLRLAMEHGSRRARLYLCNLYAMQSDFDACEKVLQPCIAERFAPAMYILGMAKLRQRPLTAQIREDAYILLKEASMLGDVGAQWALSRRMARGWFGWRRIPQGFQLGVDASEKIEALKNIGRDKQSESTADSI